jgi:hypothetical protein
VFKTTAKCSICEKEIQPYEEIYVKMPYPASRGMTEIKSFLQNEGKMICEKCFNNMNK